MTEFDLRSPAGPPVDPLAARADAARERMRTARPSATSRNGEVTVSVNASGALTGITFGPEAESVAPSALGPLIVRTSDAARHAAANLTRTAMADILGAKSASLEHLEDRLHDPGPRDPVPAPVAPEQSATRIQGIDHRLSSVRAPVTAVSRRRNRDEVADEFDENPYSRRLDDSPPSKEKP